LRSFGACWPCAYDARLVLPLVERPVRVVIEAVAELDATVLAAIVVRLELDRFDEWFARGAVADVRRLAHFELVEHAVVVLVDSRLHAEPPGFAVRPRRFFERRRQRVLAARATPTLERIFGAARRE
jgi:hypothetical protein